MVGGVEFAAVNVFHFYHVYAAGAWVDPLEEHVQALRGSGLLDRLGVLCVGLVGDPGEREQVRKRLTGLGVEHVVVGEEDVGWEQVTQVPLWEFAQDNDGLVLYAHTKGAANPHVQVNHPWRRTMCYYNVTRWVDCVEALQGGVDAAGVYWLRMPQSPEHADHNWFFAGTYWWSSLGFVRRLQRPPMNHRWDAEGWIGYQQNELSMKVKDFNPVGMPGNFWDGPLW